MKANPSFTTFTGKLFYPFNPIVKDINIIDIAHSLSNLCRFTGHSKYFYSVAQHYCYACDLASNENKLEALCHDFSEAYLNDINSAVKPLLSNYKKIEENLEHLLAKKFKFRFPYPLEVKNKNKDDIDNKLLYTELDQLMNYPNKKGYSFKIKYWSPKKAEKELLKRFYTLTNNK